MQGRQQQGKERTKKSRGEAVAKQPSGGVLEKQPIKLFQYHDFRHFRLMSASQNIDQVSGILGQHLIAGGCHQAWQEN